MQEAKQPTNEKQKKFFDMLIKHDGNVRVALEAMGDDAYSREHAYNLCHKYKDYVLDLAESRLLLDSVRATAVISNTMSEDGSNPAAQLNMSAAIQILDRVGLTKQERMKIETDMPNAIFFLPSKDKEDDIST